MNDDPALTLDHLFRRHSAAMLGTLVRILGTDRLALAEESVQDALVRALELWPYHGMPDNPAAWLVRVARNRALDEIRRERSFEGKRNGLASAIAALHAWSEPCATPVADDQLRLLFLCCHPEIQREARVALALKMAAGLSAEEIARAFLTESATVAQRIVRAKRVIRDRGLSFELPASDGLRNRLETVLEAIYLIFSEGSAATAGAEALRQDLVQEALRLARMLAADNRFATRSVHALLALMLLHAARIPARVSGEGELLMLDEQDRTRWDASLVREGLLHFDASIGGDEITSYHVEAAIAFCHAAASSYEETDWSRIVELYDDLSALTGSPVVALNRAVAVGMAAGPYAGIAELDRLEDEPRLHRLADLPAARGELLLRAGDAAAAAEFFRAALDCPMNDAERRRLRRKLARCEDLRARDVR